MSESWSLALGVFLFFPIPTVEERDRVQLRGGKDLLCRVLVEGKDRILLEEKGKERWVDRKNLDSLDSMFTQLESYLIQEAAIPHLGIAHRLALAEALENRGLSKQSKVEAWRVLRLDPANEAAHLLLGHQKSGERWLLPFGQDWLLQQEIVKRRADWDNAWELESEHFVIRSNRSVFELADLARDLELFYIHYYRLFASVELRQLQEPISVHLFKDRSQFPVANSNNSAYFSSQENRVYLLLEKPEDLPVLFHELTHALNFNAIARKRWNLIPAWFEEGLGEYFAASVKGKLGRLQFEIGAKNESQFDLIREQKNRLPLNRMFQWSLGDFYSSPTQSLRYAQCYSFVHFLFHAFKGLYREGLFAYLRSLSQGISQSSQFLECLGESGKNLEELWWNETVRK